MLSNDCYTLCSDATEEIKRFSKSAIAYLFSDPRLKCTELSEQDYMEGQVAYRSQQNEQALILAAILKTVNAAMPTQKHYSILSIGCGSGLFEKPFVKELLSENKSVHFVGLDPNEVECFKAEDWCKQIYTEYPNRFTFEIHPVGFEDFQTDQSFDIILLIHVIFYFLNVDAVIRKANSLLNTLGLSIIAVSKRWLLNEPFYHVLKRRQGKPASFAQETHKILTELSIPFRQEHINFLVNITKCFESNSILGKQLLNFMLDIDIDALTPSQLRLFLDYFRANAQMTTERTSMLPHASTLFYLEKLC